MTFDEFDAYVQSEWDALPLHIKDQLRNVLLSTEEVSPRQSRTPRIVEGQRRQYFINGTYMRSSTGSEVIEMYHQPFEEQYADDAQRRLEIRAALRHEIMHALGLRGHDEIAKWTVREMQAPEWPA